MKPLIETAIVELCNNTNILSSVKMVIADLGCSSGPNALALVSIAVEAIRNHFFPLQQPPPEVCVLLNDLPDNDFNMVVKSMVALQQTNEPVCVTGIVPGSFYERLFPSGSLHLVCSSNSLHWLSKVRIWHSTPITFVPSLSDRFEVQVPEELRINHIAAYDIDEHVRRERLPVVTDAYARQFKEDFTLFLKLRAKELFPEGQMVLSLAGRRTDEISEVPMVWGTAAQILCAMASEVHTWLNLPTILSFENE
jgi:jasmonate O-methyltransferase